MPNWSDNTLTFTGPAEKLALVKAMLSGVNADGEQAELTYNIIVPQTPEVEESLRQNEAGSVPFWYEWRIRNWGVKWDAGQAEIEDSGDRLSYRFSSPWDSPRIFYQALVAKLPEGVTMKAEAIHEDGQQYEEVCIYGC